MLLIECVRLGVCDVHGISVMGGYAQIYAFPCVHVFTDSSLASAEIRNGLLDVCVCVSMCLTCSKCGTWGSLL